MRSLLYGRRGAAMAAPSSSSSSASSLFSPSLSSRLDPTSGANALLRSAEQCGIERPNWREMACRVAPDRDAFAQPAEQTPTPALREHDAALCLIKKLDEFWFFDSVVRWPRSPSRSLEDLQLLLPLRSIEMAHPDSSFAAVSKSGNEELLPRPRFEKSEYTAGEFPLLKLSDADYNDGCEKLKPECSREQLTATGNEISDAESRVDVIEPHLDETEPEGAGVKERKQADERLEALASPVKMTHLFWSLVFAPIVDAIGKYSFSQATDQGDTATLMALSLEAVKPMKRVPIPSAPNSANVHLSRRHRRRKERKNKLKGTEHVEHDEVKGFKELGFSFSQDKLTPRVISLFPGMKVDCVVGKKKPEVSSVASAQYKLCSSPAWWAVKPNSPLYNWQFPDPHQEGVDMKAHLKFWARAVASTVWQEC